MTTLKELLIQKEALEQKIQESRQIVLSDAIAKVRAIVADYGLTKHDVFGGAYFAKSAKPNATKTKVAAKYRDPVSGRGWSGRGLTPRWLLGRDKSEFLIPPGHSAT